MHIVIDIPEEIYEGIKTTKSIYRTGAKVLCNAVVNGTSLPKGHGRLIDADTIYLIDEDFLCQNDYVVAEGAVDNAPTIIEADEVESEDKRR